MTKDTNRPLICYRGALLAYPATGSRPLQGVLGFLPKVNSGRWQLTCDANEDKRHSSGWINFEVGKVFPKTLCPRHASPRRQGVSHVFNQSTCLAPRWLASTFTHPHRHTIAHTSLVGLWWCQDTSSATLMDPWTLPGLRTWQLCARKHKTTEDSAQRGMNTFWQFFFLLGFFVF